jgi:hypothetical protein
VTVATTAAGDSVRIRVDDQGPGIPPRDRRHVWERFWRLAREEKSAVAGTGIGLAVVHELTAQHGGRAWCEEAPGGGARFLVELPRTEGAAVEAASAREPASAPQPASVRGPASVPEPASAPAGGGGNGSTHLPTSPPGPHG